MDKKVSVSIVVNVDFHGDPNGKDIEVNGVIY